MPFCERDGLRYFTFESLADQPVRQAVMTRRGGVSQTPWASLNLGGTVGDNPDHVSENRRRAFAALGLSQEAMYDVWQVHSADVVVTRRARPASEAHLKADAILTDQPGLALFMRFADCVPILLYDPRHKAAGLVHAGWKGTLNQVAGMAIAVMRSKYQTAPGDVLACIGPSIGQHHYEVGPEVAEQARQTFGEAAQDLLCCSRPGGNGVEFDLWKANRLVLERAGVRQVETAGICTACCLEDWYSHRGEAGKTGRFGAMIQINV